MSTDKGYNGWSNYETWNVALWLDNEQSSHNYWHETAQECYDEAGEGLSAYAKFTGREIFTREERAVLDLEKRLKEEVESEAPDLGSSCWADLLNAALSEVDWHEIAEHYIGDVDKTEELVEEEEVEP